MVCCSAATLVSEPHARGAMPVNAAVDSGFGTSFISSGMAASLMDHFGVLQITFSFKEVYLAEVADGHQVTIAERTRKVQLTLATPRASVVVILAVVIFPGIGKLHDRGNKTLRERLGIDVMAGLKSAALRGLVQSAGVLTDEDLEARELPMSHAAASMESSSAS